MYNIGIDMATVSRIEKSCQKESFRNHVFTQAELDLFFNREKPKYSSLAANFAAKEAFSKALGTGLSGFSLKDIYIVNDDKGKPTLIAENKAAEIVKEKFGECSIHVSLSHEKEYAIAFVIIER